MSYERCFCGFAGHNVDRRLWVVSRRSNPELYARGCARRFRMVFWTQCVVPTIIGPGTLWNTTMDVGDWLRGLGLGQYEAMFRENEIDAEVLPEVTDFDLEKLGVPFGHRKRLLKAIAGLSVAAGAPSPPTTVAFDPPTEAA